MTDFNRLPLEVRRMIYRELFVNNHHFSVALLGSELRYGKQIVPTPKSRVSSCGAQLPLLQVSKAIRAEVFDIIYREAEFNVSFYFGSRGTSTASVDALFRRVGRANAALLRHVCWGDIHVEVSRAVVQGAERLLVSARVMEIVRRLLRHLPHLRLCEVWCEENDRRGSTWRLPGDAVEALPAGRQSELQSMYAITFVVGVPGTASAFCSAFCDA